MRLILASQSPRRQEIMRVAGYNCEIIPANIDEKTIRSDDYEKLPLLIARAKAQHVAQNVDDAVIIAADQVIVWNGELREKPESNEQAFNWLCHYSLHPARVINGIYVLNTNTNRSAEAVEKSQCYFRKIPGKVAQALVEKGEMLDAAGGYKVDNPDLKPYIRKIDGHINSFKGLPLPTLEKLLAQVGYQ